MDPRLNMLARLSLSFLWVFTGITSAFMEKEIGYEVLAKGGVTGLLADISIFSGSAVDVLIGIWLLTNWKLKTCHLAQIIVIATYTLLLSLIDPSFWLHPFGPLTKNIPLLALIYILYLNTPKQGQQQI